MGKIKHTSEISRENYKELRDIKSKEILVSTSGSGAKDTTNLFEQGLELMAEKRFNDAIECFDQE